MQNNRFTELDAIRGLAAISVVLYHYSDRFLKLYPHDYEYFISFKYGNLGVELFFILSGFVIFMSLGRSKNRLEFLSNRLIRLYPTYWIAMFFTFIIVLIFGLPGKEVTIYEFIINLSMLQYGLQIPSVDGVYWSLFHELMFYLLMVASFNVVRKKFLLHFCISWLIISLINYYFHIKGVFLLLNLSYAPLFIAGIYFYRLTIDNKNVLNNIFPVICYIIYAITIDSNVDRVLNERIIILFFFLLFYLNAYKKLKFIAIKPLIFLGNISYALYLIHQNFGYIILNKLYSVFGVHQILILVPITLSIIIAYIITMYLEKPIMVYLKIQLKKINGTEAIGAKQPPL